MGWVSYTVAIDHDDPDEAFARLLQSEDAPDPMGYTVIEGPALSTKRGFELADKLLETLDERLELKLNIEQAGHYTMVMPYMSGHNAGAIRLRRGWLFVGWRHC